MPRTIQNTNLVDDLITEAFIEPSLTGEVTVVNGDISMAPGTTVDGVDVSEIVPADGPVSSHSDVQTTTPATNEVLRYDGTEWVNSYEPPINDTGDAVHVDELLSSDKINTMVTGLDSKIDGLTTTDVVEGVNQYYTEVRATDNFNANLIAKTTDDLAEGTNLYYTDQRASDLFTADLSTKTTDDVTEGTNLYYTGVRDTNNFNTNLATKTTDDVAEGTNEYYTEARVNAVIAGLSGSVHTSPV